jgi:hypothetical protein
MRIQIKLFPILFGFLFFLTFSTAHAQTEWLRQFGTSSIDGATAVAADATAIYVAGYTQGTFSNQTSAGDRDGYLRKYDVNGNALWTRQFGTSGADNAFGVVVNSTGVYVCGSTEGALPDQSSSGSGDAYLRRYDTNGNLIWTRQFGTSGSDSCNAIASYADNVYIGGLVAAALPGQPYAGSGDSFVRRYNSEGTLIWTRQFGTSGFDSVYAIAVDGTGVSAVGLNEGTFPTQTSAGDRDAYVRKLDLEGNFVWTRQFGTAGSDIATAAAADGNGVYVAGNTVSVPSDTFVRRYDSNGNLLWNRQFGTLFGGEVTEAAAADSTGVYITGRSFPLFLRKYDPAGNLVSLRTFPSDGNDPARAIAVNASRIYIAGQIANATIGSEAYLRSVTTLPQISGLRFVPVTPCRVMDTRPGQGTSGLFGPPTLQADETRLVPIAEGRCSIPATARAYSLNVTVVPAGPLGFLALWPAGEPRPGVSTLNSFHGGVVSNAAITAARNDGAISVYATHRTDVIIDVNGYFAESSTPQSNSFYTTTPCRMVDTRNPPGPFGAPSLVAGPARSFSLLNAGCAIPASARAYSLNATVVPAATLDYLTLWPSGQAQPLVSTLNSFDGAVVANSAIVQAGFNGAVSAFATNTTDLVLDTNGYFGPPGSPSEFLFYPIVPCRAADTRNDAMGALRASQTRDFAIAGTCGVPPDAKAYALNVTVLPVDTLGYLTLWPSGTAQPPVSTINSFLGRVVANAALTPAGLFGTVSAFATHDTHVILDVNGYFR